MEEYIAPAKTSAEIKHERAEAAAAKVKAEAEAARAAAEEKQREEELQNALRFFDEETQRDAETAVRKAREQERKRMEAELQAEAQKTALSAHDRRKLEKRAEKGDEVARAQLLAADAVQKKAQERLAAFDRGEEYEASEKDPSEESVMEELPAVSIVTDKKERKRLEKDLRDIQKDQKFFGKRSKKLQDQLIKMGDENLLKEKPRRYEKFLGIQEELDNVEAEISSLAKEAEKTRTALGLAEGVKLKKKTGRKILAIILVILIVLGSALGIFVYRKLSLVGTNVDEYKGMEESEILKNDIDASSIDSITDASSLTALMKTWYTNDGESMHSKNVKNILFIGIDSDSKLSDSMMVFSVNRLNKTLSLVSFYRDSYTYMETKDGASAFAKMNAAYRYGGADLVMDVIEKDYKIKIDDYALVGYDTFPALVDALGGVDVKVTEKEAKYLNKTWKKWTRTGKKIQFKSGKMHMDGEHALMFSRIRKLDSDINRTERQRRVVTAIMNKFKTASLKQVNTAINTVLPEVKTSLRKSEMLDLTSDAVTQGWLKYPMTQAVMPPVEYCKAGYADKQWIWICDYQGAAYELQKMLYGQSNIKLDENRKNALDFSDGKTMTTTRGQYAGNQTYTTRATRNRATNGGIRQNTTAYHRTSSSYTTASQGGSSWQPNTTAAQTTQSQGNFNPWWWRQSTTTAQQNAQPAGQ